MSDAEIFGQSLFNIIQFTIWGILSGGIYALVALGIVIINKSSGVFNFAHGWLMFIGGLFFWQVFQNGASNQVTVGLSLATAFLVVGAVMTMGIGVTTVQSATREDKKARSGWQARLEKTGRKWLGLLSSRRFQIALIPAIIAAVGMAFLLNQEESKILRGAMAGIVGSILIGMFIERFTIRPLLGQSLLTAILMTLAVGFIIQGATQLIWGADERPIPVFVEQSEKKPISVPTGIDENGKTIYTVIGYDILPPRALPDYVVNTKSALGEPLRFPRNLTWGFAIAISTFVGFVWLFQYTSIGLAMRATAENQILAESVGLRVRLILAIVWGTVAVMAGIAGVIQGTGGSGLSALVIPALALRVFPAVLLGGMDSVTGALVGGIIIGIVEQLSILFISTTAAQEFAPFIVLIIVLYFKPTGLFGQKRIDRV
ncbi:MAG: branched-chain amino acid ABC transporter permease [Chloroflexi bacterium]|nr:branched-chain amino acid ABC transporter permease [Chloroflexota bacterium]